MTRAAQSEALTESITIFEYLEHLLPHWHLLLSLGTPNNVHAMFCTTQKYIDSIRCLEEAALALIVGSH